MNSGKLLPPLYKVLVGGESKHFQHNDMDLRHYHWSLPTKNDDGTWTPGAWHEVEGDVVLCYNGLHLTPDPLAWWLDGCVVYRAEAEGIVGDPEDTQHDPQGRKKVAAKRVRLLYPIDVTARLDARATALLEAGAKWRRDAEEKRVRFEAERPLREAQDAEFQKKCEAERAAYNEQQAARERRRKAERRAENAEAARVLSLTPRQRERERKAGTVTISPVMQALTVFRESIPRGSDRRFNDGLFAVMKAAIESHVPFDESDVEDFFGLFRAAVWLNADRLYTLAVKQRHVSACRSIEHYLGRKPWLVKGSRLAIDSELIWKGKRFMVTSFNDKTDTLTACSYEREKRGGGQYETNTLDGRLKITRDAFRAAFGAAAKAAERKAV